MVGAGAVAGTLAGGHTNAARSPEPATITSDNAPILTPPKTMARVMSAAVADEMPRPAPQAAPAPSAAAVVAMRFPAGWQTAGRVEPAAAAPPTLAYAPETPRNNAARPAPEQSSGYQLASVDPAPMPKRIAKPKPKNPVLFNDAQLASIKARLKLTRDQEPYWPQVEQALRAISWKIAQQQDPKRPVRGSQASMIDPNSAEVARLKSAAFPLIMSMRDDQKQEVRQLAHTMGLKQVATMF